MEFLAVSVLTIVMQYTRDRGHDLRGDCVLIAVHEKFLSIEIIVSSIGNKEVWDSFAVR